MKKKKNIIKIKGVFYIYIYIYIYTHTPSYMLYYRQSLDGVPLAKKWRSYI